MTMITPSYLGETIEYSSLHACRSTLEDPTSQRRGTIISLSAASSSFPCGGFWFSCCTVRDVSTAEIVASWSRRFPGAMASTS